MYEAELWVRLRFGRICRRSKLTMYAGTMMVVVHGRWSRDTEPNTRQPAVVVPTIHSAALIANPARVGASKYVG